jgi:hypothetical protein
MHFCCSMCEQDVKYVWRDSCDENIKMTLSQSDCTCVCWCFYCCVFVYAFFKSVYLKQRYYCCFALFWFCFVSCFSAFLDKWWCHVLSQHLFSIRVLRKKINETTYWSLSNNIDIYCHFPHTHTISNNIVVYCHLPHTYVVSNKIVIYCHFSHTNTLFSTILWSAHSKCPLFCLPTPSVACALPTKQKNCVVYFVNHSFVNIRVYV